MPECGSQVVLCGLPVRLDTYRGCGHGCAYCFASCKRDLANIQPGEGVKALRDWIGGRRTLETNWCDWPIPLHWGGMSDPFQPAERELGRSLACLRVFAETGYPVVISTKGAPLLATRVYRVALARCKAVVQVSAVAPELDQQEPGAPSFAARLRALPVLVESAMRVLVRVQPYMPELRDAVLDALPRYAAAGVWGVTVEGLKSRRARPGLVKLGTDFVYPVDALERDFAELRLRVHALGLRFYAAENRLRAMGDDQCCCGVDGLAGFRPSRANLSGLACGRPLRYTRRMAAPGTAGAFKALAQDSSSTIALRRMSYREALEIARGARVYRQSLGLDAARNAVGKGDTGREAASDGWRAGFETREFNGGALNAKSRGGNPASDRPAVNRSGSPGGGLPSYKRRVHVLSAYRAHHQAVARWAACRSEARGSSPRATLRPGFQSADPRLVARTPRRRRALHGGDQ